MKLCIIMVVFFVAISASTALPAKALGDRALFIPAPIAMDREIANNAWSKSIANAGAVGHKVMKLRDVLLMA